jgi:hypothetical protein
MSNGSSSKGTGENSGPPINSDEQPAQKKQKAMVDDSDDSFLPPKGNLNILTEDEMLSAGLKLLGWLQTQTSRVQLVTKHARFVGGFGAAPHVLAKLWETLQTTSIEAAKVDPKKHSLNDFLCTMHFLYRYPTEIEGHNMWKRSRNTTRKWNWFFVEKIRALKADLFGWPANNFGVLKWVLSVDGTHFRTQEPSHPDFPKDPSVYSFKHHCECMLFEKLYQP